LSVFRRTDDRMRRGDVYRLGTKQFLFVAHCRQRSSTDEKNSPVFCWLTANASENVLGALRSIYWSLLFGWKATTSSDISQTASEKASMRRISLSVRILNNGIVCQIGKSRCRENVWWNNIKIKSPTFKTERCIVLQISAIVIIICRLSVCNAAKRDCIVTKRLSYWPPWSGRRSNYGAVFVLDFAV